MSNGGYKGSTPARETSPEQYPGVWELTEQFQAQADGNWPFQETDCAPKSLRFDTNASLERTFNVAGNTRVFTFSAWIKLSKLTGKQTIFSAGNNSSLGQCHLEYDGSYNQFWFRSSVVGGTMSAAAYTEALFRDPSAWASIVLSVNTTAQVEADRCKLYFNGVSQPFATYSVPLNGICAINNTGVHRIGRSVSSNGDYLNSFLSGVHFIDGQALSCEEFGFFDGQGIWQPKRFTGDYSSGPVYSNGTLSASPAQGNIANLFDGNIHPQQSASGSAGNQFYIYNQSAITYTFPQPVSGTFKVYAGNGDWNGSSSNSGGTISLNTGASVTLPTPGTQFYYATVGVGTNVTSITFNPANGGILMGAIYVDDVQLVDASVGRNSFHLDFADSSTDAALGFDSSGVGNDWTPNNLVASTTPVDTVAATSGLVGSNINVQWYSGYNFSHVDSDIGADPGNVAFLKVNFAALGLTAPATITFDSYQQGGGGWSVVGNGVFTDAGNTTSSFTYSGNTRSNTVNIPSGATYFAIPGSWTSANGGMLNNGIHNLVWAGTSISNSDGNGDSLVDSPVNGNQTDPSGLGGIVQGNYAVLNPLATFSGTLSNGNLKFSTSGGWEPTSATIGVSSGKWYWEYLFEGTNSEVGITAHPSNTGYTGSYQGSLGIGNHGDMYYNGTNSTPFSSFASGSIIGMELDLDNGTFRHYVNGVAQSYATQSLDTSLTWFPSGSVYGSSHLTYNFGQRPYKYQNAGTDRPSADYKSLCTSNLPEPSIPIPSQYFDAKLYTSNASDLAVTGLQFSPSFVWVKNRELGNPHGLFDIVRGPNKYISSGRSNAEINVTGSGYPGGTLNSFDSNGFTLGADSGNNVSNYPANDAHVAWAWSAGDATTTIAVGGLNSSVYDQSQTFSSGTLTGSMISGREVSKAFDADSTTFAQAANNTQATFVFNTPVTITGTVTFKAMAEGGNNYVRLTGNSGNSPDITNTGGNGIVVSSDVSSSLGTTITGFILDETPGTGTCRLYEIRVGGKLLVDSGVSVPNVPSTASTVRSSPESGFSIVKYTGTSSDASVAHGLNAEPEFIIIKNRTTSGYWVAGHTSIGWDKGLYLNTTSAQVTAAYFGSSPSITANTFSIGTASGLANANGDDFIAYCFSSVEAYSSVGSYLGNGSTDGPFVALSFRPAFIIGKRTDGGTDNWFMNDSSRLGYNDENLRLYPNLNNGEGASSDVNMDILSNGFKLISTNSNSNGSGATYIYYAVAESPFKNARAR